MTIYNIDVGRPFLRNLAAGIIDRFGGDPIAMGQTVVLLPTRRGCLSLKEIFKQKASEKSLILPRIYALADLEQEPILPGLPFDIDINPPIKVISKWQRLGHLTQLVQQFLQQKNLCHTTQAAYPLAQELATLLDEFYISNVELTKLETLVEDEFSNYWQQNLAFLKIISSYWPAILEENGLSEAAQFQQQNLRFIATHWRPSFPVILAGTTGTRPATAELARKILDFPQGMVVLPGFDPHASSNVGPTHPNYTLSQFVSYLGGPAAKIQPWREVPITLAKTQILHQAMAPLLTATDHLPPLVGSAPQIILIPCATADEEALVIATILRSVYEQENETAALITPDQGLTRRVQAYLQRWDIEANVSAGTPLSETVVGTFLSLIGRLASDMAITDWIALLKHPLFLKGEDRGSHLGRVRQLECEVFRKKRGVKLGDSHLVPEPLRAWYDGILEYIAPVLSPPKNCLFPEWLALHLEVALGLAGPSLWMNNDGEVAHTFLKEIQAEATAFPPMSWKDYAALLGRLQAQVSVHRRQGIGSPLKILGTLEARQTEADVMILAGLNETVWPQAIDEGPWLSNQMRLKLGLSSLQRRLGLAAHDFCLGFSANGVYLTRSEQHNGSATVPSRLWQRVQTVLKQYQLTSPEGAKLKALVRQLDQSDTIKPGIAPQPQPPSHVKPKHYSVTDIERLLRDPYSVYAKNILKLKKLEPLDQPLTAREWGQLVHQVLDLTFKRHHPREGAAFVEAMKQIGRDIFTPYLEDVVVKTFWWYRFQQICDWIGQIPGLADTAKIATEVRGQIELMIGTQAITLTAIADRIDTLGGGKYQLVDYKTGMLPTEIDIRLGFAPQLALEGLILKRGGFGALQPDELNAVYWELKGGLDGGTIKFLKDYGTLLSEAANGLEALLSYFHGEGAVYLSCPWGEEKVKFNDYRQLARVDEWM
ncbi:PD-(D/E)XK nuclease family protein [Candidatus Paracaedibacter symbiosus]|uniref:PD-(D/E)XK nuclease family protein n=1 Tax=Candidatus Paracaedibacter symbiosus TaxID=244582 RepID=UPI000509DEED|nr:PD-(D/E)XK nuclease family protein [Candidatus Paracaedibacter symbiosus]